MARLRLRGEVLRADTRDLTMLHRFEGFADLTGALDLTRELASSGSSFSIDPADYGLSTLSDVYLFCDSPVLVTLDGETSGQLDVDEILLVRGTQLSGLTVLNNLSGAARVRILFGGD